VPCPHSYGRVLAAKHASPRMGGVMSHTQEENGVSSPGSSSPSGGPEPELKYLARYTHRVAMTLEAVEFIRIGGAPRQRL
jgi:hypothetical protein